PPPLSTTFPYPTLFRSPFPIAGDGRHHHRLPIGNGRELVLLLPLHARRHPAQLGQLQVIERDMRQRDVCVVRRVEAAAEQADARSEEHTSELQSHLNLV